MVEKEIDYIIPLVGAGFSWVRVVVRTVRGVVVDFAVQLEIERDGREFAVVRYDASHNQPHRDVLDSSGKIVHKRWMPDHFTISEALQYAVEDLTHNYQGYVTRFTEDYLR